MELRIFFWFGIFCLSAAVGEYLPVREFLFRYVPMMNVFRFPSVFRLFFILGAVLSGVWTLQHYLLDDKREKRTVFIALGISLCAMIAVIVSFRLQGFLAMGAFLKLGIFSFNTGATFAQLALLESETHQCADRFLRCIDCLRSIISRNVEWSGNGVL
jgi:hypothetical protein